MFIDLKSSLDQNVYGHLQLITSLLAEKGLEGYLIGGMVRDLLLDRPNVDLDISVGGDAREIADAFSKKVDGKLTTYESFLTATVTRGKLSVDFASFRKESYLKGGSLPVVTFASFFDDLLRRDFSINAMGIALHPAHFGLLQDPFGGYMDLKKKLLRILHPDSFLEDPTRILRGLRFLGRFGYRFESHSLKALQQALEVQVFQTISKERIAQELKLILEEPRVCESLVWMQKLGIWQNIFPQIPLEKKAVGLLRKGKRKQWRHWMLYAIGALLYEAAAITLEEALGLFCPDKSLREGIRKLSLAKESFVKLVSTYETVMDYDIYQSLLPIPLEILELVANAREDDLGKAILHRFKKALSKAKISISGDDLQAMGIEPGRRYAEIFDGLKREKINGRLQGKRQELAYVKKIIQMAGLKKGSHL